MDNIDRVNSLLATVDYMLEYNVSMEEASKNCCTYSATTVYRFIHNELKHIDDDRYKRVMLMLTRHTRRVKRDWSGKFIKCDS